MLSFSHAISLAGHVVATMESCAGGISFRKKLACLEAFTFSVEVDRPASY